MPTASAYFKYVSIEATTTRASTVIRSMPTREIRTHASMTMPLSRIRSRTSMRLVPPGALSIAMSLPSYTGTAVDSASDGRTPPPLSLMTPRPGRSTAPGRPAAAGLLQRCRQPAYLFFQRRDARSEIGIHLTRHPRDTTQGGIVTPPIQPYLLGLVKGAHQQPDLDREQLDIGQRDFDVASDDQALVQNAIEDVDQPRRSARHDIGSICIRHYVLSPLACSGLPSL